MDVEETTISAVAAEALARRIDRPVVLVGLMGVGKTSVGKRLAGLLHCPFIDADHAIEEAARMTIPEIFEGFGEDGFRDGERRVIARLIEENPRCTVIATGGGAFCNPETRALILERAIAVWLDCDIDTLVERTGRRDNRPLLREGDPRAILTRLREERAPAYAQAPIHVTSVAGPLGGTLAQLCRALDAWL
ncbi:MAG: shikimate kinase [Novosphingobium sp.]